MTAADSQLQTRAVIQQHSKSFALASRLLPPEIAADAVLLYAYCRRADDQIDLAPAGQQAQRLEQLRQEIAAIYSPAILKDPLQLACRDLFERRQIPRAYLDELLAGMEMDAGGMRYQTWDELLLYCYRVAGTVGLMMSHVMGVRRGEALRHAAHLGMAMQLTNIARDVFEDWMRQRLYLPAELLRQFDSPPLDPTRGEPFPEAARAAVAAATGALLSRADAYYRSGDAGVRDLSPRCALAVRTARHVYARIGSAVRARGCDPLAGRAVVSRSAKLLMVGRAAIATLLSPATFTRAAAQIPSGVLHYPALSVLP